MMADFDYDVIVIGSGFGGSVAALRATEKGYRVGVMEAGRRWPDSAIPKTNWDIRKYLWQPEAEMYGLQRLSFLDDVLVLHGAGVGGGSHVYGSTLYVPPKKFFAAPEWSYITDWYDEMPAYFDQAQRMMGVNRVPYMDSDKDRLMREIAVEMGHGDTYNKAPVATFFGSPGVEVDDPFFGGAGPRRTGCVNCGNCMIGCGRGAKNKLTENYLYLAEKNGCVIHDLHEVTELAPLDGGGYEVIASHPGWVQRAAHVDRHRYTARQVVVSAHAYGSARLLHHMRHIDKLTGLSDQLGKLARTNSEALILVTRPYVDWKKDPDRFIITPGSVAITSGVWPDPDTSIEPVSYGVGSDFFALATTYYASGPQKHPTETWLKHLMEHPVQTLGQTFDARHWSERAITLLCMQTTDTSIDLYFKDGILRSRHGSGDPPPTHIPAADEFAKRLAAKMGGLESALDFEVVNRTASAHFIGGIPIGDASDKGVVDPYQRVFGHPDLHVMDGSVMPANPGVNPSLTILALAERAMSFWPNKGDADPRPSLGAGYQRLAPIMPRAPAVPAQAPGALRFDKPQREVIPEYPY
ncbi:GMC family oxidoreductase [Variovorax sp. J31P207]|uniref:GMC oxidoreductase n=1 Tax=Variovorax sp. J31P207 TaxID=3053510 RepID=UPI002574F696|nr:GMC family oxidoreductase [Variovorax sp. J31P207]MDM0068825.1 GMC family oxidoreductase [Variovorax sp. J31P207]